MILSRTQPANFAVTPAPQSAYELLAGALPQIQRLLPEYYEQAVGQSLILRTSIGQTLLAREERSKRLKGSENPKTGYQIVRGFKALTVSDEDAAIALVDHLLKSDLRPFALIGILSGLNDLLAKGDVRSPQ